MKKFWKWIKDSIGGLWKALFYKDEKISKTSVFLSLFSLTLLAMWIFQGLFGGVTLLGWWLVPEFNIGAAVAVMSIFSALYIVNRSKLVDRTGTQTDVEELASIRQKAEELAAAATPTIDPSEEPDDH